MKKIQTYENETERNQAKTNRRRADLDKAARAAGYDSWDNYGTAVRQGLAVIPKREG